MLVAFVCSGNICRSPMAEALARAHFARDGLTFASAGTHAASGSDATGLAAQVMSELGIDLGSHRSSTLADVMALRPDAVFVMTAEHESFLRSTYPGFSDRVTLLDASGSAIADPYGRDIGAYRYARDVIEAALLDRSEDFAA